MGIVAEGLQVLFAPALGDVAVDTYDIWEVVLQAEDDGVDVCLGLDEDDRLAVFRVLFPNVLKDTDQHVLLLSAVRWREDELLDDVFIGVQILRIVDDDLDRVCQERAGQLLHFSLPSGTEHKRLAVRAKHGNNLSDLGFKPKVQHLVRLIEHKHRDPVHGDHTSGGEIDQAAWSGHHNLTAADQLRSLAVFVGPTVLPTVRHPNLDPQGILELLQFLVNLQNQLAGGGQD
mmetsp:Transcript_50320/g.89886  ORF Transcript_50320/g.89886 Transcript_50320/m.89886 type:complete len:231 (+) Transcript_50320:321-1013(+)